MFEIQLREVRAIAPVSPLAPTRMIEERVMDAFETQQQSDEGERYDAQPPPAPLAQRLNETSNIC